MNFSQSFSDWNPILTYSKEHTSFHLREDEMVSSRVLLISSTPDELEPYFGYQEFPNALRIPISQVRNISSCAETPDLCVIKTSISHAHDVLTIRSLRDRGCSNIILVCDEIAPVTLKLAETLGVKNVIIEKSSLQKKTSPRRTTTFNLTEREIGVLQLVSQGHNNKAVGEQLGLSPMTIKSHLSRIGRKMGSGDKARMVALALAHGIIS